MRSIRIQFSILSAEQSLWDITETASCPTAGTIHRSEQIDYTKDQRWHAEKLGIGYKSIWVVRYCWCCCKNFVWPEFVFQKLTRFLIIRNWKDLFTLIESVTSCWVNGLRWTISSACWKSPITMFLLHTDASHCTYLSNWIMIFCLITAITRLLIGIQFA